MKRDLIISEYATRNHYNYTKITKKNYPFLFKLIKHKFSNAILY